MRNIQKYTQFLKQRLALWQCSNTKLIGLLIIFFTLSACQNFFQTTDTNQSSIHTISHNNTRTGSKTSPTSQQLSSYDDTLDYLREHFSLLDPTKQNQYQQYIVSYQRNPETVNHMLQRARPYLYYIVEELERRQLPTELALLPIVESGYDPYAYSHGQAAGLWQIIPSTASHLGVTQNEWIDGRRDIQQSTAAALDYLAYLAERFNGDWYLALAAYNAGEGTVSRAIRNNERAHQPTDYWHLKLPQETRQYVPRLLALAYVIQHANPEMLHTIDHAPHLANIDIGDQIELTYAAELADISVNELISVYNPGFNQGITPPSGPHTLLLPIENARRLQEQLQTINKPYYNASYYTVQSGDNLAKIANIYRTSVDELKTYNDLKSDTIYAEQRLRLPPIAAAQDQPQEYTTRQGDSLWKISQRFNVTPVQLATWNNMQAEDPLPIGKTLTVLSGTNTGSYDNSSSVIRRVSYPVRQGDSLAKIAQRFNITIRDITGWNPQKTNQRFIHPGENLILYIDVTQQSTLL